MAQYAGKLHAQSRHGGLRLAETSYRARQRVAPHAHGEQLLVFVLSGLMNEHVGGRTVRCPPGTVLFHPAGERHSHLFDPPATRCLVLEFGSEWLGRLEVEPALLPERPITRLDETAVRTGRLLHHELRQGPDSIPAALDGLALTLLALLGRPRRSERERVPFVERVCERLHDDPGSGVDLASLAELAGVSAEHLARTFRRQERCTVGEYVRRVRVERAREALDRGEHSLGRLALELGFSDQSHFTRTFKAHTGCTPGEYRRRARRSRDRDPPA